MEDESQKIIPTRSRTKIPRSLSYAAGAQMISLAWEDVQQFEFLELRFLCWVSREIKRESPICSVLSVNYHRMQASLFMPRGWVENGGRGPLWSIDVSCCRHEDAHEIREWLRDVGLSQAREWLHKVASLHGEYKSLSWSASFDEDTRLFSVFHKE